MFVLSTILQRVFFIRYGDYTGTCFTADVDGKRYLITARHLVEEMQEASLLKIMHGNKWKSLPVNLVGHGEGYIDISVLAPQQLFGASHPLNISGELIVSETVYFLGYPYEWSSYSKNLNQDFPLPLVKKATVSGIGQDRSLVLLDGHNNRGFSGGPVVREANTSQIIGVISGYRYSTQSVLNSDGSESPYIYHENTGIVTMYGSNAIEKIIASNPIGREITKSNV